MKMDMFGLSSSDFGIDDLLNIPNDDVLNSSSSSYSTDSNSFHNQQLHLPQPLDSSFTHFNTPATYTHFDLCVPSDDAAELEWLSRFVDDSFTDFPTTQQLAGAPTVSPNDSSFSSRTVRSKRSTAPTCTRANANINTSWSFPEMEPETWTTDKSKLKREPSPSEGTIRRCSHCASEKTPQWRTGPLGPKTLCNACGVRYKSGRLVPEYRPAASPTFVLTQHSNSHRKVMELRRQKEIILRQQPDQLKEEADEQQQEQFYSHLHGFQVS